MAKGMAQGLKMKHGRYSLLKFVGVLLLASMGSTSVLHAEIYKYTDKDGMVHYTNIKPANQHNVKTFSFPCYVSDPKCQQLDWERIPLDRQAFSDVIQASAEVFTIDESLIRAIIHAESPTSLKPFHPRCTGVDAIDACDAERTAD